MRWGPEFDDALRKFAEEGKSKEEAARILKVTRNAVAGRAHRIGVKFNGPQGSYRFKSRPPRFPAPPKRTPSQRKRRKRTAATKLERILARMDAPIPKDWRPPQ